MEPLIRFTIAWFQIDQNLDSKKHFIIYKQGAKRPNLNLLDFFMWFILETKVSAFPHTFFKFLKAKLQNAISQVLPAKHLYIDLRPKFVTRMVRLNKLGLSMIWLLFTLCFKCENQNHTCKILINLQIIGYLNYKTLCVCVCVCVCVYIYIHVYILVVIQIFYVLTLIWNKQMHCY